MSTTAAPHVEIAAELAALRASVEELKRLVIATAKLPPSPPARVFFTAKELAAVIGKSERWVTDQCAARLIPVMRRKRPYLIPAGWVEDARRGPAKCQLY